MDHWLSPSTLALLSERDCCSNEQPKQEALSTYHVYPHLTLIPGPETVTVLLGINPREYLGTVALANLPALVSAIAEDSWTHHHAYKDRLTFAAESHTIAVLPDITINL